MSLSFQHKKEFILTTYTIRKEKNWEVKCQRTAGTDPSRMSQQVGFCKTRGHHENRRKYKKELKKHIDVLFCEGNVPDFSVLKMKTS